MKLKSPNLADIEKQEHDQSRFARGLNFYKIFWIFMIGCFLGVIIETIWCFATRYHFESRVGLIYGPFNLVYGFGAIAMTLGLYWLRKKRDWWILIGGTIIGSVVEYICSWVQESMFGSISWDYSKMNYNLGGRINLLYSLFWGILAILWVKEIYPRMSLLILKIPNRIGKSLTWILLVFMIFNTIMSAIAVDRWVERKNAIPASNPIGGYMDTHYPDSRMENIYPNMFFVDTDSNNESKD